MLRRFAVAASAVALLLAGCREDLEKPVAGRIRILATTDEHSHLLATGPEVDEWPLATTANAGAPKLHGGVARRATVFEQERADGTPTFVFSNGDFSQGTLSAVAFTVANFDVMLMRQLGYDAIALGNHEFDSLPSGLAASITAAKTRGGAPPFVLTNAIFSAGSAADDSLEALYGDVGSGKDVVKGLIVEKGGVRIGIVSAMGPSAAYDGQYTAAPVKFSDAPLAGSYTTYVGAAVTSMAAILQPTIDALRSTHGADAVVLLFHGGRQTASSPNGDVEAMVGALSGLDLVIAGHTHGVFGATATVTDDAGRSVPVVQPAAYGDQVARVEFTVDDGRVSLDAARTAYLDVDDRIVPTTDGVIRNGLSTAISSVESSLMPSTLQAITGTAVPDNGLVAGDLYFYSLGTTTYDILGATLPRETNALNLDTDAMLAVTKGLGYTVDVALQNAGSIRGDLLVGESGTLAFADVFRMVSLGGDPFDTPAGPGYPLVRTYLYAMELKAAFEQTLQLSYLNNDYYLGEAGLAIEWDPTRTACASSTACATGAGWITSMQLTDGAVDLYDPVAYAGTGGWAGAAIPSGPLTGLGSEAIRLVPVVTTYLVASFAGNMGVTLKDAGGNAVTNIATQLVEWTGPGTPSAAVPNVKDHQALARYIKGLCDANGGELPPGYDAAVPNRVLFCPGGVCP
jgi:2',3'-cyclic-nucleotide 2'-phosphodiesterase (5'-nucleotidase family)